MKFNDFGTISVRVYTAGGALPLGDAVVRIKGAEEENRFVEYSVLTDADGVTGLISLPTPDKLYSLSPSPGEIPYAVYDIEITKDGYYTKRINNIAAFSGVRALQEVGMIPISISEESFYPRENLDVTVRENDFLL